jgi:hypothetical protein
MNKEKLINQIMADAEKDGEPVTREEAEEMAEMEIKANGIKSYTQADKPKKVTKERKVDKEKKHILGCIKTLLEGLKAEDVQMKTETELSFLFGNNSYSLKLIKHRPPK